MPEKLLDLHELSAYLRISEENIRTLVTDGVIPAYKIGGSFLRFRKEQIDAIKNEILEKAVQMQAEISSPVKTEVDTKSAVSYEKIDPALSSGETLIDKIQDFFYFSDFYIISALLIALMLLFILRL